MSKHPESERVQTFWEHRFREASTGRLDVDEATSFVPEYHKDSEHQAYRQQVDAQLLETLRATGGLKPTATILEPGCGAGKSTKQLAIHCCGTLVCTEPNADARILWRKRLESIRDYLRTKPIIRRGYLHDLAPRSIHPTHVYISGVLLYQSDSELQRFVDLTATTLDTGTVIMVREPQMPDGRTFYEENHRKHLLGRSHFAVYRSEDDLWRPFNQHSGLRHLSRYDWTFRGKFNSSFRVYQVL